jgi:hypothetical protein
MIHLMESLAPTILFGAVDRHNFGDLLFPHIAAALLPGEKLIFAGLAERDLRPYGGHRVRALPLLVAELGRQAANILHVGGELLTCDVWQAAVMLLPPDQAQATIARLDALPQERLAWAQDFLSCPQLAPYTLAPGLFGRENPVLYNGVGGVDLASRDTRFRAEVEAKLRAADHVGVRDRITLACLAAAGIEARLMPDPAVMVAELFGKEIRLQAREGETAQMLESFPPGYIAVQFSADYGDDATLAEIAAQLDQISHTTGLGVVFFRAGAAPWHDDLDCYQRTASRMQSPAVKIFSSLNLWAICALIAHSRAYCGSSLHGRILAMAFALPRINLRRPAEARQETKHSAYASTWEVPGMPISVEVQRISQGMREAMAADPAALRQKARELVSRYRKEFEAIRAKLK